MCEERRGVSLLSSAPGGGVGEMLESSTVAMAYVVGGVFFSSALLGDVFVIVKRGMIFFMKSAFFG